MKLITGTTSTPSHHGRLRWAVQIAAFISFVYLFVKASYPPSTSIPYSLFQKGDPLIALAAGLGAGRWLAIALVTIVLTICLGRIFCSYFCPLGCIVDVADRAFRKRRSQCSAPSSREPNANCSAHGAMKSPSFPRARQIKYWVLTGVCVGIFAGNASLLIVDPLSLLTRVLTVVVYPLWLATVQLAVLVLQPIADRVGLIGFAYASVPQPVFQTTLSNFLMFLLLLTLVTFSTRFWCRSLCPLGALLGLLSRISIVKRTVSVRCIDCGRCSQICPMAAIGDDPRTTYFSECIQCEACSRVCPVDAIAFRPARATLPLPSSSQPALSRRGFVAGLAASICFGVFCRIHPEYGKSLPRLVRPPGAIPEPDFLAACTRCGLCIRSCVTHTLQPAGMDRGILLWGTPIHLMRVAGCEQQCNMCGRVCPTGAIRNLSLIERQHAKVGTAVIYQSRCVAWRNDQLCLLCDEACPYNAIVFHTIEGHKRPFVDESKCNGCGMCEHACPVEGEAAIIVHPDGSVRIKQGSYVEILRQRRITLQPSRDVL